MNEFDPRVEYKKQVALKFDYILNVYISGVMFKKACNMKSNAYISKLRDPKEQSTLNEKHLTALEDKLDIPKDIFDRRYKFDSKKIDEQIATYRVKMNRQKIEKTSVILLPINTQLTLQQGRESLIGRKIELKEIDRLLKKESVLLIYGIGGIGKSALISYYLYEHKKRFDYYGLFEGVESFIDELKISLKLKSEKSEELFRETITKLRKLKGSKLLVVDGIKEIDKYKKELDIIRGLKEYGYTIIFTSREIIEDITSYKLNTLHNDDARKLFNSIYKIPKYKHLTEILNYLDYHPLFIELTAKALKNKTTLTHLKLKEKFYNGEFPTINIKRKESFHNYLGRLFSFENLDNEEILVLKKLSVLPSKNIKFNFLREIFDIKDIEEFEDILNYLVKKGWLNYEEESYKLHQIIKEYILDFHLPKYQEIEEIVDFFIQTTLNNVDSQVSLFFTDIGNIYHFLTPNQAKLFYSLAFFYESQYEYSKAKEFYQKTPFISKTPKAS